MELHFYTTYDNIQMLREGDNIQVWTKTKAIATDIHISLNMDKYAFHKLSDNVYEVFIK